MLPVLFSVGPITISTFGVFIALTFVLASYLLWRSLKEDYPEEEIINYTILLTLVALLGGRILYSLAHFSDFGFSLGKWVLLTRFPGMSLAGALLGGVIFSLYWTKKNGWDFWVLADNVMIAFFSALVLGGLGAWLSDGSMQTLLGTFWAILVLFGSLFLTQNFRKFIWYKSGKPGFVACTSTIVYFLGLAGLDFWFRNDLYWNITGGLAIFVLGLIFLYRRSGRILKEDILNLGQITRRGKL